MDDVTGYPVIQYLDAKFILPDNLVEMLKTLAQFDLLNDKLEAKLEVGDIALLGTIEWE